MEFQEVLDFWFSLKNPGRKHDSLVKERLGPLHREAARGALAGWREPPSGRLALILLLDQAPRHIHRDSPEAYATDGEAQGCTAMFFSRHDWRGLSPLELFYIAHPWLHAEDVALQEQVNPFLKEAALQLPGLEYMAGIADLYLETVRRFGRFPHRNAILGRDSTRDEKAFLSDEWFVRRRLIRESHIECPGKQWKVSNH